MKKNYAYLALVIILLICGGLFFYSRQNANTVVNTDNKLNSNDVGSVEKTVEVKKNEVAPISNIKNDVVTPVKTDVVNTKFVKPSAVSTPTPVVKPTAVTPPPAPKNIFSNVKAGYSIELPSNWDGIEKKELVDANDPKLSGAYLLIHGQTGDQMGFSFDIQTSSRNNDIAFFKQEFGREPASDQELFNSFVDTQKKFQDEFVVQSTRKTIINGNQAYEVTASLAGGGGTEKLYVFYTPNATYRIMIIAVTSTWKDHEADVMKVVSTFKIL